MGFDWNNRLYFLSFKNPQAAYLLVDEIEKAIRERLTCPESFEPYPSTKERKYLYCRIYVKTLWFTML